MEVIIAGAALAGSCAGAFYLQKAALEVLFRRFEVAPPTYTAVDRRAETRQAVRKHRE